MTEPSEPSDRDIVEVLANDIRQIEVEVVKAKANHERFPECVSIRDHFWLMENLLWKLKEKRERLECLKTQGGV